MTSPPTSSGRALVVVSIVALAVNLRPVANAMGAVMPALRGDTGLSGAASGMLLALPTLSFAVVGIVTPAVAARLGSHRTVTLALVVLSAGQLIRSLIPGTVALFAGSLLALAGIAMANVLMPGLVRLHFPRAIGPMTALYTTLLAIGATASSGLSLPIARALGGDWQLALAMWAAPAVLALIPWLGLSTRYGRPTAIMTGQRIPLRAVARTRVAWSMAGYFGLQALQAYVVVGWLPSILTDAGLSDTTAGLQVAVYAAVGIPVSAIAPTVLGRMTEPKLLIVGLAGCYLAGYLGVLLAPTVITWFWAVLLGLGGGAFPVSLTLIALRARTPAGTTSLSAFSQSVGYLIASIGPVSIGLIRDLTGGWTVPLLVICGVLMVHLAVGISAARRRFVEDELPPAPAAAAGPEPGA